MWTDSCVLGWALLAQAAAPAAGGTGGVEISSVWDFIVKGGPVMIPIGLASLIGLAVFVERAICLRRAAVIPPGLIQALRPLMNGQRGRQGAALDLCQRDGSPIALVLFAAIRHLHEPPERLEKRVFEAGEREVFKLRKNVRVLSVITSVSTLLGLLGTIFGMIRAFQTVAASPDALGRTELLARGIYEALITTCAGLIVAIPALIAYHWILARIDALVTEIDRLALEFIDEYAMRMPAAQARAAAPTGSVPSADERSPDESDEPELMPQPEPAAAAR